MSINDTYYNNRTVDYNGNNLTVEVGTFHVNGNLAVSGNIIGSEESGVDLNTNDDLYITGNSDWYFDNDDKNFFIFNDQYKKISMGYDVENISMVYSASQRDNPMFCFSGETDQNTYGAGTGNRYLARFQNYSNVSGSSGLDIVLNRTDDDITNANIFLNFSGFTGSTFDNSGYIAGLYNDQGLGVYSGNNIRIDAGDDLVLRGDKIKVLSDNFDINDFEIYFSGISRNITDISTQASIPGLFVIHNKNPSTQNYNSVLDIKISREVTYLDKFIRFMDPDGVMGSIHGASKTSSAPALQGYSPNGNQVRKSNVYSNSGGNRGGIVFASTGADFGEDFEFGDELEWNLGESEGIAEGIVVYVYNQKFYKDDDYGRIPMIVTRSSAFVGNSLPDSIKKETLSLLGQIKVFVKGLCNHGDYILPVENYCIAVSPEDITFDQYKKALGITLESKSSVGISQITCLVGRK